MPFSAALTRLIARLDSLPSYSSETLAHALGAEAVTSADTAEWTQFDERNYRRNLVVRRAGYELRVLCWQPRQRTSLHGHRGSACAFRILSGTSTEIRLRQP